jgi:PAS domain S-box-containing protein
MNLRGDSVLDAALEQHPDAYLVLEHQRVAFGNRAASRLFGEQRLRPLAGRSIAELLVAESRHEAQAWTRLTEGDGWTAAAAVRCLALDGRAFPAIVRVRALGMEFASQLHVVLRQTSPEGPSLERHRGISDDFDRAESLGQLGRFALQRSAAERDWFSEGFARIIGHKADQGSISREGFVDRFAHPQDRELVRRAIEEGFERGRESALEFRIVRPDGSARHVRWAMVPVCDRNGRGRALRGTLHDITDRVLAAGEFEHQTAWLSAILEAAVQGIITIDETGAMQSANRAAERVFGYTSAEMRGRNVSMLMPPEYSTQHDAYLANYMATGIRKIIGIGREVVGLRKDGTAFPMELAVGEVRVGNRRMFTGFVHDISERKQLEAEFLRAQKTEVVGRLAEGIAHDFNNLLMGIRSCASLAQERRDLDGPARILVQEIENATQRGMALTKSLLAFSRSKPSRLVHIRLSDVIAANQTMLQHLISEDIELAIEPTEAGDAILGDAGLIEQILVNLVINARDAMPSGGRIRIAAGAVHPGSAGADGGAASSRGEVALVVTDTGLGIEPSVLSRIFEPFFTTKEPGKGTGLGLATVQQIVKQLSGRVEVDSVPGSGTTFRIFFAAHAGPEREAAPALPASSAPLPGTETVLLVEDDSLIRSSVRRHLSRLGYRVIAAGDGQEALELAAGHSDPIDVLVTDVVMPGMGGRELAERLLALDPKLRTVFMSAHAQEVLVEQGRLPPNTNYLEKPYDLGQLSALLRKVLDP